MTPELAALVEKVREAMDAAGRKHLNGPINLMLDAQALAAIRCIAEATREASEGMNQAGAVVLDREVCVWADGGGDTLTDASVVYSAMHAASVLGEALRHGG